MWHLTCGKCKHLIRNLFLRAFPMHNIRRTRRSKVSCTGKSKLQCIVGKFRNFQYHVYYTDSPSHSSRSSHSLDWWNDGFDDGSWMDDHGLLALKCYNLCLVPVTWTCQPPHLYCCWCISLLSQTLLHSCLPTNSLLARSYNDVFDWLVYLARNCYIRELSVQTQQRLHVATPYAKFGV